MQAKSKFATKKWYVIDSQTAKGKYNQNNSIKFETETFKLSFCDYSDSFILLTRDITVATNNDTEFASKNCAPFSTCKIEMNDVFNDEANHIDIAMAMYNLIECSDNYADTPGSLWQFERDEVPADNTSSAKNTKIVVPLKYPSNFWRSLEMPLINCKIHLELNWTEDCILSIAGC